MIKRPIDNTKTSLNRLGDLKFGKLSRYVARQETAKNRKWIMKTLQWLWGVVRDNLLLGRRASSISSSARGLADVSKISILTGPIYTHEISHSRRYTFGDFRSGTSRERRAASNFPFVSWDPEASHVGWIRFCYLASTGTSGKPGSLMLGI